MSDQEFNEATKDLSGEDLNEALVARYNDEDLVKKEVTTAMNYLMEKL